MTSPEDHYTNTEADAERWAADHAPGEEDERPTPSDLAADPIPRWSCRRGCGGRLWDKRARDTHEAVCVGSDPWGRR